MTPAVLEPSIFPFIFFKLECMINLHELMNVRVVQASLQTMVQRHQLDLPLQHWHMHMPLLYLWLYLLVLIFLVVMLTLPLHLVLSLGVV